MRRGGGEKRLTKRESSAEKANDLPLIAIEVGVGILFLDLLDEPPGRRGEGDMVARTSGHAGVKKTDHVAQAIDDEGTGVALGGEIAGLLVVVEDGELDGLLPKVVGSVSLQARVLSDGEVARVSVLENSEAGLIVAIDTVGIGELLARGDTHDPELAIGGELEQRPTPGVVESVELVAKFSGSILGS